MSNRYANWYKKGAWNVTCQRTGFKIKNTDSKMEWDGSVVRRDSWEERHPQDYLKSVKDEPAVPWSIPRPTAINTNRPNLLVDFNGQTADGIYWILGTDWSLNSGDGWQIDSFATSTDLISARDKDIVVGTDGNLFIGDTVTLSCYTTLTTRTAGSFIGKLGFYDVNRESLSTSTMFTLSADAANTRQSGSVAVPASTVYIAVVWDASSLDAATFELRNVKLEVGSLTGIGEKITTSDL